MANFALTVHKTALDYDSQKVADDLHDHLEGIDNTKNIRLLTIVYDEKQGKYVGITIYDT